MTNFPPSGAELAAADYKSSAPFAIKQLQATIERIERENARQTKWMLRLTFIAAVAAAIAAVPVAQGWLR